MILGLPLGPRAAQVTPRAVTKFSYFPYMARMVGKVGTKRLPKDPQIAKVIPKVNQIRPKWDKNVNICANVGPGMA